MAKKLLFTDYERFNRFKKIENDAQEVLEELKQIYKKALGIDEVTDYKKLIETPTDYLAQEYWRLHSKNLPKHLDKTNVFTTQTGVNIGRLNTLSNNFEVLSSKLGEYAPKTSNNGVLFRVKQENFNKYLKPELAEHYEKLERLLEVANELKQYEENTHNPALVKYSQNLIFNGLVPCINVSAFV